MLKNSLNVIILAIALVISAFLFSNAFQNRNKSSDTISVTGLGKTDFVSDLIVWKGSFSKKSITFVAEREILSEKLMYNYLYNSEKRDLI